MPRVPTYDSFQVTPSSQPTTTLTAQPTPDFGAEQQSRMGQAQQAAGEAFGRIAIDQQSLANQVRVDDALNQARQKVLDLTYDPQAGYLAQKGAAALDRPDGQALPEEYSQKLQDSLSQITDGLGNDAQKRAFALHANDLLTAFHGDVERHAATEFRNHSLSVQGGTIKLGADAAKRNWNDPDKIGPALDSVKAAVVKAGQLNGESANETMAKLEAATSAVHLGVIEAALQNNNPTYAQTYLARNKDAMTADDILRVNGAIDRDLDARVSQSAVQASTTAMQSGFAPSDMDRLRSLVLGQESGGRDFAADGSPLTSDKGAKYAMQVTDATAKAPGFGIRPAADDSPAEYNRVGREYLNTLVQKYGNVAQALAAYNAGPGALDAALTKAEQDDRAENWVAYLPKETQAYVQTIGAKFAAGGGAPAMPTLQAFVSDAVGRLGPDPRPQQVELTRAAAERQYDLVVKSRKQQGDQALTNAQQALIANGFDFDALDPQIKNDLARLAPDKYAAAVNFAKTLSKDDTQTDPELYATLATYPDELAKLSDAQFLQLRTKLSDADFKHFAKDRADLLNGKTDDSAGALNTRALNTAMNYRLESIGINPTPKAGDLEAKTRIGTIQKFVRDDLYAAQTQLGRKLTPAEIETHVDQLFAKNLTFRNTVLGFSTGTSSQNMLSMTLSDIPSDSLTALRGAFAARGVKNPTDADLLGAYWKWKNKHG